MKKTLIASALIIGFAGAAQAQMSIYGLLDVSYGKSIAADAAGLKADFNSGGDNGSGEGNSTSRFGIKGSTDIGSGFKANFKLESNGITSDGDIPSPTFARQAWLGISGSFGEVRLGRQDSVPFQVMAGYDFNGASNGISSGGYSGTGSWLRGRQSRSLQYISPAMGGVTVQAGFVPKGNVVGGKNTFSGAVTYAAGPLSVSASFETARVTDKTDFHGERFMSLAGSYDFGVAKVMLGFADGGDTLKGVTTGFVAPVAGWNIGALMGKNSDTKGLAYELFVNKEVLKNTIVYAEFGKSDKKTGTDGTGYALGLIYVF
jgi:predicted porin